MTAVEIAAAVVLAWLACLGLGIALLEVTHRRHARQLVAAQDQAIALAMSRHPTRRPLAPEDDPVVMARISAQARRNTDA